MNICASILDKHNKWHKTTFYLHSDNVSMNLKHSFVSKFFIFIYPVIEAYFLLLKQKIKSEKKKN